VFSLLLSPREQSDGNTIYTTNYGFLPDYSIGNTKNLYAHVTVPKLVKDRLVNSIDGKTG